MAPDPQLHASGRGCRIQERRVNQRQSGPRRIGALLGLGAVLLLLGLAERPLAAIPRLDLTGYPPPAAGERRWVIQLSGLLPPTADPTLATDPADWRVQVLVGRTVVLDCNLQRIGGELRSEAIQINGAARRLIRATGGAVLSTRMACPAEGPRRPTFLSLGPEPFLLPYNVSQPIVVDAPRDLEVRWRLWKAERQLRPALAL